MVLGAKVSKKDRALHFVRQENLADDSGESAAGRQVDLQRTFQPEFLQDIIFSDLVAVGSIPEQPYRAPGQEIQVQARVPEGLVTV